MAINEDTISGNWEQLKGKVKATWGKFTDNDLLALEGRTQEMIGKLQELYGYSRDRAEEEWRKFTEKEKNSCRSDTTNKNSSCCN